MIPPTVAGAEKGARCEHANQSHLRAAAPGEAERDTNCFPVEAGAIRRHHYRFVHTNLLAIAFVRRTPPLRARRVALHRLLLLWRLGGTRTPTSAPISSAHRRHCHG